MKIPNYDSASNNDSNFKRLLPFMPSDTFRMLICGPSGCGKTNVLMHMLYNLLYYDKIYLFSKNLEQPKYRQLLETFRPISEEVGYDVIEESNGDVVPLQSLDDDNQKIVIFDDYVCERNQKPLIEYFIGGRHKNCSVISLIISLLKTSPDSIALIFVFLIAQVMQRQQECAVKSMYLRRNSIVRLANLIVLRTLIRQKRQ